MKTNLLLTCIALLGAVSVSTANHRESVLRLNLSTNGRCVAQLDHVRAGYPGHSFLFTDLPPGHHRLVVKRLREDGRHHSQVLFDGNVFIPEAAEVTALLERNGMLRILDIDQHVPYHHCSGPADCNPCSDLATTVYPITEDEFEDLYRAIQSRPFESTRVEIACRLLRDNYLTTDQVASMLSIFSFDSNRLEVAKAAYRRTVDRERFYKVFDTFTFDNSVRELAAFMDHYS